MQEIMLGGSAIGTVRMWQEGLYRCFDCRCRLSGEVIYRIQVKGQLDWENLGIPVPQEDQFVLRTRLPAKRLGEGPVQFRAVPVHDRMEGRFIPLSPEEPFRYLRRLQDAFLQQRGGKTGVVIRE